MKKYKIIALLIGFITVSFALINTRALTIVDEAYDEIDMVGKYELTFAVGANVYGYCQGDNPFDIYCDNCHDAVRLPGDNGGRIPITDKNGRLFGWGGNSSSSILPKPSENAKVVRAYLMQEADVQTGSENVLSDYAMTLKGPKGGSIKPKVNKVFVSDRSINSVGVTYTDVTDFVKQQGFGKYEGWDIPYVTKGKNHYGDDYAAWRLIVICEDPNLPIRMLRMKIGSGSTTGKTITLKLEGDGFVTKSSGNVTGQIIIAGGGGDPDIDGSSLFDYRPSPNSPTISLNTGTTGNMNRSGSFMQTIVTHNGVSRSDVRTLGYRPSDHTPIHNTDLILMDVNSTQNNAKNGHNAYFVNNSNQITLSAITTGRYRGNLDLFGMLADIDTATYGSSMSHSGNLYPNSDITMKAYITNNTQVNKSNLGVSGGYALITADNNITLDTSRITAVYTHNGTKTTLPKSMITVNGNTIKVIFGANAQGRSYRGDTLEVTFHGSTDKEQLTLDNVMYMYAPKWIDETGNIHSFGSLTTMTSAKDDITIAYNNPPLLTTVNRSFYEGEYSVDQWYDEIRMQDITATDKEDGTITNKIKVISDNVNPLKAGNYTVRYQVEDSYGKTVTKTSDVEVKFNNPPIVNTSDLSFYEDELTKEQFDNEYLLLNTTATDVEDGSLNHSIKVTYNNVDPSIIGKYQVVYEVSDRFGKTDTKTRNVTIKYNHPPEIDGESKRFLENEYTVEEWLRERLTDIAASDREDGNITDNIIVIEDNVNVHKAGFYKVVYKVTDRYGKMTKKSIEVEVIYNQVPIIVAENKSYFENELSEAQWQEEIMKDISAFDSEDGELTPNIEIIKDNVNLSKAGAYEVTYRVSDSGGKVTEKTIDVTIKPNHQPTLDIFAENKRFVEGQYSEREWLDTIRMENVSAHDLEDNDLSDDIEVIHDNVDVDKAGVYEVSYRVTDRFGKSKEKTIKVTVEPNLAPIIHASDRWFTTQDKITEKELLKKVIAYDDTDGEITDRVTIKESNVQVGKVGEYTVIYTVTDSLGKTSTSEAVIHIDEADPIPPSPVDPPVKPSDNEAVVFSNGKKYGLVTLDKVMEESEILNGTDYESVVFGVYSAEDIHWNGVLILKANSLVGIIRLDSQQHGSARVYHEGNYYVKEIAVNEQYQISDEKYPFHFSY